MNKKKMNTITDFILDNEMKLKAIQDEAEKKELQQEYEQKLEFLIKDIFENNNSWKSFDEILFEIDDAIQENIQKSV